MPERVIVISLLVTKSTEVGKSKATKVIIKEIRFGSTQLLIVQQHQQLCLGIP